MEPKEQKLDETLEQGQTIKVMTAKEIKRKFRPEFQKNYQKYYPVDFFHKINFVRNKCTNCNNYFWNINPKRTLCGDSNCVGTYTFIGKKNYLNIDKKFSLADAWQTFEDSFVNERIPCTKIDRYPVVARWRNDVDYVQAGIYCFQPYCVTGEMKPPANPLICPQFCVRFNDLDNIGLTGRHYSGFVMIGIQVFNYPNEYHFFKEECVEFNYNWLTKKLKIPVEEICFSEDIWAGGGNMGPCVEYFVHGMEVGNMVFMQYKTFHDGSIEELKIKIIDTGIGLERVAWLMNGDATSYLSTFRHSVKYLQDKLEIKMDEEIWAKLGPYSTMLDVDECEDMDKTWKKISDLIGMPKSDIVRAIEPMRDIFIILDHTRSIMFLIRDGSLPSNIGGGFNLRNILRRTFAIMQKNKWWDKIGFDGYMKIFDYQEKDIENLYKKFEPYESFEGIIKLEHERWQQTDKNQQSQLKKLLKKKKQLKLSDWHTAVTSWGIPPDTIAHISKQPIPDNLYLYIDEQQQRIGKKPEQVLYDTSHLKETVCLYYDHLKYLNKKNSDFEFEAKLVEVFCNVVDDNKRNIVIFDQTCFYPTSGGQEHDSGYLMIKDKKYNVVNVEKVGHSVLHTLDQEIGQELIGEMVLGYLDVKRRLQLRNHHTSAHIIFAASRKVLGPHIWQQGAKKTTKQAHLDITHFTSLSKEQELQIQEEANRIVMKSKTIKKTLQNKEKAEKDFGFKLYQGGVVPGNTLRVVQIEDVDVEACCGTHCDNTSEVGWIKVLTTKRIADGVVRIYFVAGERTLEKLRAETEIINDLTGMWKVQQEMILETAQRIFKDYKKQNYQCAEDQKSILKLQVKNILLDDSSSGGYIKSGSKEPTLYFANLGNYAKDLKEKKKNVIFYNENFVFGFFNENNFVDQKLWEEYFEVKVDVRKSFGSKKKAVKDCQRVMVSSKTPLKDPVVLFEKLGLKQLDLQSNFINLYYFRQFIISNESVFVFFIYSLNILLLG